MNALFLGLFTGLDNLAVSAGFGAQTLSRTRRMGLIAGFAGFETLMPLLGFHVLGQTGAAPVEELGPLFLIAAGLLVAWPVLSGARVGSFLARSGWLLVLAPLALSLDNLALGAGMAAAGGFSLASVLLSGVMAAALSVAGLVLGQTAARRLRFNPQIALAACLVLVGTLELAGSA